MKQIRFVLCGATFFFLLLLSVFTASSMQAQEPVPAGGTVPTGVYLPLVVVQTIPPTVTYESIPVMGPPTDRPPPLHADLNLALRSYTTTIAELTLIDLGGDTDSDAPQLAHLFDPPRRPAFVTVYQVFEWEWNCGEHGCRVGPLTEPPVTLLEMTATPNEQLFLPRRNAQIFAGEYKALVLYAEEHRLTLVYTREDTVARGYTVHLEDIRVDPGLLALYQQEHTAGRGRLPALRNGQRLGFAWGSTVKVVIRDTGSFMEPRSRKDWWQGY
jgi:hypothetical protein